jgi:hypothetical protein
MMRDGEKTFVRITQQMIYDKQREHDDLLKSIHDQTMRTNGRVTELEKRSWGVWVRDNPYKFTAIIVAITIFLISIDSLKDHALDLVKRMI